MLDYRLSVDSPAYLALLALAPVLWWLGYRSLSALGGVRRLLSCLLRTVVYVLIVLALAETKLVRTNDKLTVVYVVDRSLSVPQPDRIGAVEFVNRDIEQHKNKEDWAGVIVFGRDAAVERPPFDEFTNIRDQLDSRVDPEYTDLASAIKLAQASFPHDTARRIVIISDGNQNLGDAMEQARIAADAGVSIDVLPITYGGRSEVMVEKLAIPPDVRKGEPFDLRVVVNNTSDASSPNGGKISGQLRVTQRTADQPVELDNIRVELPPGKSVFVVRQNIEQPDFYTYEAVFVPDDPKADAMPQNNRATTFTHVRGAGQVLLIEDASNPGQQGRLVDKLRSEHNLEVTVQPSNQLFTNLAELQQFDTVVLANVPRSGGDDAAAITHFSDEQIRMLVRNTESLGAGLVMLGGPNSFGAGGWTNTELEKAMPVDFQIKNAEVIPKGALALVMHASEMADGNYWQKVIAKEAIKALGTEDYAGLLHWNGNDSWLWGGLVPIRDRRNQMLGLIDRMVPGDMPQFDPGLQMAVAAFRQIEGKVAAKHMIIISDGDPAPPSQAVINALKTLKVTVSSVAVGCHGPAESKVMEDLALQTGGKYYQVSSPQALPKIFQREARRVAQPLVYENRAGFKPEIRSSDEIVQGIGSELPPITGFVRTTVKRNPLVEVPIVSPAGGDPANCTILATWTYGLGRAVAFTTDTGAQWAKQWPQWSEYDKFFGQMIRWSMRPVNDQNNFVVATDVEGGRVRVFVTALDKNDEFLNFLDLSGSVIGPNMDATSVDLEQTAPGRYVGSFPATDSGSYFLMISPGPGKPPIRLGVNVPYSAEFSAREADPTLLSSMAALVPKGGEAGQVIEVPADEQAASRSGEEHLEALLAFNPFRHDLPKATNSQDIWHLLLLVAACLFFFDVFFRRVTVSFAWVPPMAAGVRDFVLRRQAAPPQTEYMERLRSRKAEVSDQLEQRRAVARFEIAPDAPPAASTERDPFGAPPAAPPPAARPQSKPPTEQPKQEESYTSRLLKAKQKVWEERDKKDG